MRAFSASADSLRANDAGNNGRSDVGKWRRSNFRKGIQKFEDALCALASVTLLGSSKGSFKRSAFYLQRLIDLVNSRQRPPSLAHLRRPARALLRLSTAVAQRTGLAAFTIGKIMPKKRVSTRHLANLNTVTSRVTFSPEDLASLDIDAEDLDPSSSRRKTDGSCEMRLSAAPR